MHRPMSVQLKIKEGPVVLKKGGKDGIAASHQLWDGAVAVESFPATTGSAFYAVTLEKPVTDGRKVREAEKDLTEALLLIARAWSFSGGTYMIVETREVVLSSRVESNAHAVEQEFLAREGLVGLRADAVMKVEFSATYHQPPLSLAIEIAKLMRADFIARQLLTYFDRAWVDYYHYRSTALSYWFVDLYKVRDLIAKFYGGENAARSALGIIKSEWSFFGDVLNNNDLRHAEVTGTAPPVPPEDVARIFAIARTWISSYLVCKGITSY
jgi:hypothetical protein